MDKSSRTDTDTLQRLQRALRRRHPVKTAAHVASDIGTDQRTVEGWLAQTDPQPPIWRHFDAMLTAYPEVAAAVCMPQSLVTEARADLRRTLDALERTTAAIEAALAR